VLGAGAEANTCPGDKGPRRGRVTNSNHPQHLLENNSTLILRRCRYFGKCPFISKRQFLLAARRGQVSRKIGRQQPCVGKASGQRPPGRAPKSPGKELLGPSGSHHLWGQADSVGIEQSVLGLAPSHPPVRNSYSPPPPRGSHPAEN